MPSKTRANPQHQLDEGRKAHLTVDRDKYTTRHPDRAEVVLHVGLHVKEN